MRTVRTGPVIGLIAALALLVALAVTVGLGTAGWVVGVTDGVITAALLTSGLMEQDRDRLGPADRVTLTRAVLVGGIAALVADSFTGSMSVPALVGLSAVALALDAVDGWVARRTATASTFGARFDMEVDAFLILVLSGYVAVTFGRWWVLAIGGARYLYVAAGWLLPWMRGSVPPRYWRKVVAAVQGVVLAIAAADVLPVPAITAALAGALVLLAESFGRDVWWLWGRRVPSRSTAGRSARHRGRVRAVLAALTTALAALLVWFALVAPNQTHDLVPSAFVRIPVEGVLFVALVLALPARFRAPVALLVGVVLGLLTVLKVIDMGFFAALDRPFNPVTDWGYLESTVGVLSDSIGKAGAVVSVAAAALLVVAVVVCTPLAVLRMSRILADHRTASARAVVSVGAVWVLCAVLGVQIGPGEPFASTSAATLTYDQVHMVRAGIQDQDVFAAAVADDRFGTVPSVASTAPTTAGTTTPTGGATAGSDTPPAAVAAESPATAPAPPSAGLLAGLRGKDVIVAFVESYGRVAVQDSTMAAGVDATLDAGTQALTQAGFQAQSAFLHSPTFGGLSWLAHSTFQSGLWIDNQQRYDQLVASNRLTLSSAFKNAGWRTVADVPSNETAWPEGARFYGYDKIYDETNLGYVGPKFSYAAMPDQYIMSAFHRTELAPPGRGPVMAEIDLVSSHWPWAPLPDMVEWNQVGDGSIFNGMPEQGQSPDVISQDPAQVRAAFGQSIQYSLNTLVSFVQNYGDRNLVLIMLGDHEPHSTVSGEGTTHDVPISVISQDPAVLKRMSGWGWENGLHPGPQAPVWPMDAFRDRFLTAYNG